jgi:hypothetical protein
MSWIATTDPLALLAIQAGQINAPTQDGAAAGGSDIDRPQRFIEIGEPVPIVFARFRNSKGGILISPGATEARFQNDASNNVTAYYHLPLSEGQIDSIPVKDVFQQACRVGDHTQTYDRRAGTWTPGNYITQQVGYDLPAAPYFCGSVGLYPNISTLSFNVTIPDGFDQYNRQVHLFIRGGMYVTRIYDSVTGPSDNFADLVKWLLVNTSRVPSAMIDNTALLAAATFLEYNGFTCNCELSESTNYADLVAEWAPYFLLGESNNGGKKALRPLLPVTAAGQIKTTAITPEYVFTDDTVIAGTVEIDYLSLADRLPFVAQVVWRQQLESDIGIIRTAEVRYAGTAESGPYETHDLSAFCTSEDHAVKVGAYILAKRVYPTHVIRFSVRPQSHCTSVAVGDIVAVSLTREATNYVASMHSYLYQVERITKTLAGDVSYEATHFPVDSQSRSLIALDVTVATGTGIIIPSGRTGVSCDINSSTDNTIPVEEFIEPGDANDPGGGDINDPTEGPLGTGVSTEGGDPIDLTPSGSASPSGGGTGFGGAIYPGSQQAQPDDGLDSSTTAIPASAIQSPTGDTIGYSFPEPCAAEGGILAINLYKDGALYAQMDENNLVTYTAGDPATSSDAALVYLGGEYGVLQVGNGALYEWDTICKNGATGSYKAVNTPTGVSRRYKYRCTVATIGGGTGTVDSYFRPPFWLGVATCSWTANAYDGNGVAGYAGIFITGQLPGGQCQYQPGAVTVTVVFECVNTPLGEVCTQVYP